MTKQKYINACYFLIFSVLFVLHIPFLNSDPDVNADPATRGAWTDEGLNSVQSRNYILTDTLSITDNDTWIQGPVYGLLQIPAFKLFGIHLSTARLIILALSYLLLLWAIMVSSARNLFAIFIFATLFEFHIFSFSHFSLPYMLSLSMVIIALVFFVKAVESRINVQIIKFTLISSLLFFAAFLTKVFFLYTLIIPILTLIVLLIGSKDKGFRKKYFSMLILFAMSFLVLILVYYVAWYLPNQKFYDFVVFGHIDVLLPSTINESVFNFSKNFRNLIWGTHLRYLFLLFIACIPINIYNLLSKKSSKTNLLISLIALIWFAIEIHRFAMWYLPFRYILGFIFSMFLFSTSTLIILWDHQKKTRMFLIFVICIFLYLNLKDYKQSLDSRTYSLDSANTYFASAELKNYTVIGPWAASINWNSDAYILPVQYSTVSYKNVLKQHDKIAVVTEYNQEDNNLAFAKLGINLPAISDSLKEFILGPYKVNVYWLRKKQISYNHQF